MRCLSIRQPWAHAILQFGKRVENRQRADGRMPAICRHRGPLLIHASKTMTREEYIAAEAFKRKLGVGGPAFSYFTCPYPADTPVGKLEREAGSAHLMGGIVGVCEVIGYVEPTGMFRGAGKYRAVGRTPTVDMRWHVPGSFGLVLEEVREVPFTPWKGALGLFEVPDEVAGPLVAGSR